MKEKYRLSHTIREPLLKKVLLHNVEQAWFTLDFNHRKVPFRTGTGSVNSLRKSSFGFQKSPEFAGPDFISDMNLIFPVPVAGVTKVKYSVVNFVSAWAWRRVVFPQTV